MEFIRQASRRGWLYTGAVVFNRVVPKWLFRCRRYVVYRLKIQPPPGPDDSVISVSWCESENQTVAVESLTHFKREYSAGPVRAIQAVMNGQLVGGFWVATEMFDEDELGVRVILGPEQVWLFGALVSQKTRGRGVYSKILQFTTSELSQQAIPDQLVAVNPDNKLSNSVHKKNAIERVGTVFAARFVNFSICFADKRITRKTWRTTNCRDRPIAISFPLNVGSDGLERRP